jgi:hypothetical protein
MIYFNLYRLQVSALATKVCPTHCTPPPPPLKGLLQALVFANDATVYDQRANRAAKPKYDVILLLWVLYARGARKGKPTRNAFSSMRQ